MRTRSEAWKAAVARGDFIIGGNALTQGWVSPEARERYWAERGPKCGRPTPPPAGSVRLKFALLEIAEATGASLRTLQSHWRKGYKLPLVEMRRTRTYVDVDPASIQAAVDRLKALRHGKASRPVKVETVESSK